MFFSFQWYGNGTTTSNAAHAFGAMAGFLIGFRVLKDLVVEPWERIFKWINLGVFGLLTFVFVIWHIAGSTSDAFNPVWFQPECWNMSCIHATCST